MPGGQRWRSENYHFRGARISRADFRERGQVGDVPAAARPVKEAKGCGYRDTDAWDTVDGIAIKNVPEQ